MFNCESGSNDSQPWLINIFPLCPSAVYPSAGITVDKYGVIFFVDGTMIRRIDQNGIISTLLGFNDLTSARPLSCDAVMDISQVRPPWPPDSKARVVLRTAAQPLSYQLHLIAVFQRRFFSASACFTLLCLRLLRFPTAFWVKVLTGSAFVNWLQGSSFGWQEAVINAARGRRRLVWDLDDRCPSWLVAYIQFIWPSVYVCFPCIPCIYIWPKRFSRRLWVDEIFLSFFFFLEIAELKVIQIKVI